MSSFDSLGSLRTSPVVSVNGELQSNDGRGISPLDRGVLLADGLFETMRARNGRLFRFDRHLRRLQDGLSAIGMPPLPLLPQWVTDTLAQHGTGDARVRVTVTRGSGPAGLVPPADPQPTVIVAVWPLPDLAHIDPPSPITLHVVAGRRNEHAMSAGLKTLSYTDGVMAIIDAQRHGADEALFLDTAGHVSETTGSNIFIVAGGALVTPPISCGVLPGITRRTVIELAATLGIGCAERPFGLDDLRQAEEAFVTNSTRGPVAVASVHGVALGAAPGAVTRRLADAWRALVLDECR